MNLKKSLSRLVILTMLFTGCSNYQVQNKGISLPDEATKQKTMTKVQNDVNEIIEKDYEYVLSNLGKPSATVYWIDKNKVENLETLDDIEDLKDIGLVYFKTVSEEDSNSTALYLKLENDVVIDVQIVGSSSKNTMKELDKSKVLINSYTDGDIVKISDLNMNDLDDFVGIDSNQIEKIVGDKQPSYEAYLYDEDKKSIHVYYLDDEEKLLAIFTRDNKISEIKILDNKKAVVNEIKNVLLDN